MAPARLNTVATGMLVHITDQLTDWRYLVDTGESFSLVPHHSKDPPAAEPRLVWGSTYFDVSPSLYIHPFLYCPFFPLFPPKVLPTSVVPT